MVLLCLKCSEKREKHCCAQLESASHVRTPVLVPAALLPSQPPASAFEKLDYGPISKLLPPMLETDDWGREPENGRSFCFSSRGNTLTNK